MIRYSVRIKLTDFINTSNEAKILERVHSIGEETNKNVFLKLWYLNGELASTDVVEFVKRYETLLESIGTNIHLGENEAWTQKSWFNIRRRGTPTNMEYRYECFYTDTDGILRALDAFYSILSKMDTVQTVQKPQSPQNMSMRENGKTGYRVTIRKVTSVPEKTISEGDEKNESGSGRFS